VKCFALLAKSMVLSIDLVPLMSIYEVANNANIGLRDSWRRRLMKMNLQVHPFAALCPTTHRQ
jgi:hypothetical protein